MSNNNKLENLKGQVADLVSKIEALEAQKFILERKISNINKHQENMSKNAKQTSETSQDLNE